MGIRTAHGDAAERGNLVVVETMPADELPLGEQAPALVPAAHERKPNGQFAPGSRTLQVLGGRASQGKTRLASKLGVGKIPPASEFAPYRKSAATFRRVSCADLARTVGGGVCGPNPSSIVATAALALAYSRFFSDRFEARGDSDDAERAVKLGVQSRQLLLTAHELCAREAEARARGKRAPLNLGAELEDE